VCALYTEVLIERKATRGRVPCAPCRLVRKDTEFPMQQDEEAVMPSDE
jgi:hypothetical protein